MALPKKAIKKSFREEPGPAPDTYISMRSKMLKSQGKPAVSSKLKKK